MTFGHRLGPSCSLLKQEAGGGEIGLVLSRGLSGPAIQGLLSLWHPCLLVSPPSWNGGLPEPCHLCSQWAAKTSKFPSGLGCDKIRQWASAVMYTLVIRSKGWSRRKEASECATPAHPSSRHHVSIRKIPNTAEAGEDWPSGAPHLGWGLTDIGI